MFITDSTVSASTGFNSDILQALPPIAGLQHLLDAGLGTLPRPGHGATLQRWQALAAVAAVDLSLLKLYE
ncbi:MAG: hypothetical protein RLZZ237_3751, partial [Pseudomonadota bacterium]